MANGTPRNFAANGVRVDFAAGRLTGPDGAEVPLRAQSFAVLRCLAERPGEVVSKEELSTAVWHGTAVTDDSLVQCVRDIRRALRDDGQTLLRTVPRRGYRLDPPPDEDAPITATPRRRPLVLFGVVALVLAALIALGTALWKPAGPGAARPASIAVLPFDDMSADGKSDYLGRGVAEDIIAMLARSPDVLVMARNSSFTYAGQPIDVRRIGEELGVDYVLEGSVRREGERLRIVAQLNDARSGEHVWAERYDRAGTDPAALQDEVTGQIIGALAGEMGEVKRNQFREAWGKDRTRLGEYDYFLRGLDVYMEAKSKEEFDRAAAILREGLAKYPDSALIKAKLAWVHWTLAWDFWSEDLKADFDEADRLVSEVLARDDLPPEARRIALWLNALVMMRRGDFERAVEEAKRAVAMAPYDARMLRFLTEVLLANGQYEMAMEWLAIAEPREPGRQQRYHQMRGNLYRLMGRYDDAERELKLAEPLGSYPRFALAITYVRLGRLDEARAEVAAVERDDPGWTQAYWREGSFYSDPAILDREVADLGAAGMPE